jgi:hypothetical protein
MAATDAGHANLNVCSPDAGRPVRNAGRARDSDVRERDSNTRVLPGIRDLQNQTLTSKCSTLIRKGALILVAAGLSLYRLWKDIGREPSGWSSLDAVRELWVTAGWALKRAHSHSTRSFLPSTPQDSRRRNTVGTAQASCVCGARQVAPRAYTPSLVRLRPPRIGRVRGPHISPRACRHG